MTYRPLPESKWTSPALLFVLFFHIPPLPPAFLRPDPFFISNFLAAQRMDGGLGQELFVILPISNGPLNNALCFNKTTWYHEEESDTIGPQQQQEE